MSDDGKDASITGRSNLRAFCCNRSIKEVPSPLFTFWITTKVIGLYRKCPYVGFTSDVLSRTGEGDLEQWKCFYVFFDYFTSYKQVFTSIGHEMHFLSQANHPTTLINCDEKMELLFKITIDKTRKTIEMMIYAKDTTANDTTANDTTANDTTAKDTTANGTVNLLQNAIDKPLLWTFANENRFDRLTPFVTLGQKGDSARIYLDTNSQLDVIQ